MAGVQNESTILWMATVVASGNLMMTLISMVVVDKIKRRKLMISSLFGAGELVIVTCFVSA